MGSERLTVDACVAGVSGGPPRFEGRFEVPPGITVLSGPSGAGKSTCLSAIAGLAPLARGRICLGAEVLSDAAARLVVPPHARRIALVFQSLALFPHLTVLENVAYGVPRGVAGVERDAQARRWLARFQVAPLEARRPATLSGGEAQRVALARALASAPRVLLLDEPFSALDGPLRVELGELLVEVVATLALPTLLVTHDRADAAALGSRELRLVAGRPAEGP